MIERVCQSCAMPMGMADEMYGTNKDGSKSQDYCRFCYQDGEFLEDVTMEEMIEVCVPHMVDSGMAASEARALLENTLPNLARWHGK